MRRLALGIALASMALVGACGDDGTETDAAAPASPQASSAAPSTAASSAAPAGGDQVLTGTVGTKDDPNAFEISLTDSSGAPVTTLPAGSYKIKVNDLSAIHNFHLEGDGVDEKTAVPAVEDTTFAVDLKAGDYTFRCDPHPRMKGSLTVT
jgi:plastocyanin